MTLLLSPVLNASPLSNAQRIISLKPNITEILFALGLGDRVVGVTQFCDYPKQAQKRAKVADYIHIDTEKVMSLKPDVVLGSKENSLKKEIGFLQKVGLDVRLYSFGRLQSISDSILQIANDFQLRSTGKKLVSEMKQKLDQLPKVKPAPKVLLVVETKPFVVVGGQNLFDDVLSLMGAVNLARDSKIRYPTYSTEKLIASRPDVIVDFSNQHQGSNADELRAFYKRFPSIPAVANNRIYFLDVGEFRPSQRLIRGAQKLGKVLHVN